MVFFFRFPKNKLMRWSWCVCVFKSFVFAKRNWICLHHVAIPLAWLHRWTMACLRYVRIFFSLTNSMELLVFFSSSSSPYSCLATRWTWSKRSFMTTNMFSSRIYYNIYGNWAGIRMRTRAHTHVNGNLSSTMNYYPSKV